MQSNLRGKTSDNLNDSGSPFESRMADITVGTECALHHNS
jgi:hypothetical protein